VVLCPRCEIVMSRLSRDGAQFRSHSPEYPVSALLCARCGAVLPMDDPADTLLIKLTQLSRFGIGADDRPLLASTREGD
jgi:hypothetical protein